MASFLGSHVTIDCPICPAPVDIPIHEQGLDTTRHPHVVTVALDFSQLHEHVATTHRKTETT